MTTFNSRTESPTTSANGHSFMQELYGVKRKWHDEEGTARPTTTVARPDSRQAGDTGVCSRGGGVPPKHYKDRHDFFADLHNDFSQHVNVIFSGCYHMPHDPSVNDRELIQQTANEIWRVTGYRFTIKDHRPIRGGHRTRLWCCQDRSRKKQKSTSNIMFTPPPHALTYTTNPGKRRYDCRSSLRISCTLVDTSALVRRVTVQLQHHERHKVYDGFEAGVTSPSPCIPHHLNSISAMDLEVQQQERKPRILDRREEEVQGRQLDDEGSQTDSNADASDFEDLQYSSPHQNSSRMNLISSVDQSHLSFLPATTPVAPPAAPAPSLFDTILLHPHPHNVFQQHAAPPAPPSQPPPPVPPPTLGRSHLTDSVNRLQAHIRTIREFCDGLEYQLQFGDPRLLEELEREGAGFLALARRCLQSEGSAAGKSYGSLAVGTFR